MDHMWARVWADLLARVSGPFKFRLLLQPAVSCFLAIRFGLKDAKQGNPPYFWSLLWDREQRLYMVKEGWKSIGRVFLIALAIDVVYQIIVLRLVYPGEAVIVATVLALVPYLILRGLVTRVARRWKSRVKTIDKGEGMRKAA